MSRHPLSSLPAFVEAARAKSLRAAGEALHFTHSAISQQIATLEERLGYPLFDRRGKKLILNAAGAALLREVAPALEQIDRGFLASAQTANDVEQALRLTMPTSFAQRWLLPRIGNWRKTHPDIQLQITPSNEVLDLHRHGFHAAIRVGTGSWPNLTEHPLYDRPSRLIALGSPAAVARMQQPVTPEKMALEPLLGYQELWDCWFAAAGTAISPEVCGTFKDVSLMLQAAEHDLGLAVARGLLAADAIRDGRLVKLCAASFEYESATPHRLVYPPSLAGWPPLEALITWLHDEFQQSSLDTPH